MSSARIEAVRDASAIIVVAATLGLVPIVADAGKTVVKHWGHAGQLCKRLGSEQQKAELAGGWAR